MQRPGKTEPAFGSVSRAARVGVLLPLGATIRLYGSTDKEQHGYVPGYVTHLRGRRWRANRVLEIGVGGYEELTPGGSLRVWRDFLPRSRIVGMDISEKAVNLGRRVKFVRGDQSHPGDLDRAIEALGGPPNIVIDDGSHLGGDARASFGHLFPKMSPGSLYVIEDLHTSYWQDWGGGVPAPEASAVSLVKSLVDAVQASDPVFTWFPHVPERFPPVEFGSVSLLDVRGGVAFITKA